MILCKLPLSSLIVIGLIRGQDTFTAIKQSALHDSSAYSYVTAVSNEIGPRLTGSVEAEKACLWALDTMKAVGLRNVHPERWQLERGWRRGYARAELVSPFRLTLNVSSYGWAGSTFAGSAEAEVVAVDSNWMLRENAAKWAGKILLLTPAKPEYPMRSSAQLPSLARAAAKAHAVAILARDNRPGIAVTHTEPLSFPLRMGEGQKDIAVLDLAAEQQQLLESLLSSGKSVRIRIDVENDFSAATVSAANVVGEIPGSEHPEQVVLVGAHLDSWDLGTGAIDDAAGVASVLAAAEALISSKAKPRRTIRFVLFTGEEQGLLGSHAYVDSHAKELSNILCAIAVDWGQGPITKIPIAGHAELIPVLRRFAERITDVQRLQVEAGYLFATDAYSFTLAGVAGLGLFQDSPAYSATAHSAADTLDKIDQKALVTNSAVLALLSFFIADEPARLGEFWPAEKTADVLTKDRQREVLELFGMWPFSK